MLFVKVIIIIFSSFTAPLPVDKWEAPFFASRLRPLRLDEGKETKLILNINGLPIPAVQWYKDEMPIETDERMTIYFDGKVAMLVIHNTTYNDRGNYKCMITNDAGSAFTSALFDVERKDNLPEIIVKMKEVESFEGGEARLDVQVVGSPKPRVEWCQGSRRLTDSDRYRASVSGDLYSLFISDLRLSDTGPYKCIATNEIGQSRSILDLNVKERLFGPDFTEEEGEWSKSGRIGGFINIGFNLRGNPRPQVVWYKDGILLYDTTRVDIRSRGDLQYVNIYGLTEEDAGTYLCEARSRIGTAIRSCILKLKGAVLAETL